MVFGRPTTAFQLVMESINTLAITSTNTTSIQSPAIFTSNHPVLMSSHPLKLQLSRLDRHSHSPRAQSFLTEQSPGPYAYPFGFGDYAKFSLSPMSSSTSSILPAPAINAMPSIPSSTASDDLLWNASMNLHQSMAMPWPNSAIMTNSTHTSSVVDAPPFIASKLSLATSQPDSAHLSHYPVPQPPTGAHIQTPRSIKRPLTADQCKSESNEQHSSTNQVQTESSGHPMYSAMTEEEFFLLFPQNDQSDSATISPGMADLGKILSNGNLASLPYIKPYPDLHKRSKTAFENTDHSWCNLSDSGVQSLAALESNTAHHPLSSLNMPGQSILTGTLKEATSKFNRSRFQSLNTSMRGLGLDTNSPGAVSGSANAFFPSALGDPQLYSSAISNTPSFGYNCMLSPVVSSPSSQAATRSNSESNIMSGVSGLGFAAPSSKFRRGSPNPPHRRKSTSASLALGATQSCKNYRSIHSANVSEDWESFTCDPITVTQGSSGEMACATIKDTCVDATGVVLAGQSNTDSMHMSGATFADQPWDAITNESTSPTVTNMSSGQRLTAWKTGSLGKGENLSFTGSDTNVSAASKPHRAQNAGAQTHSKISPATECSGNNNSAGQSSASYYTSTAETASCFSKPAPVASQSASQIISPVSPSVPRGGPQSKYAASQFHDNISMRSPADYLQFSGATSSHAFVQGYPANMGMDAGNISAVFALNSPTSIMQDSLDGNSAFGKRSMFRSDSLVDPNSQFSFANFNQDPMQQFKYSIAPPLNISQPSHMQMPMTANSLGLMNLSPTTPSDCAMSTTLARAQSIPIPGMFGGNMTTDTLVNPMYDVHTSMVRGLSCDMSDTQSLPSSHRSSVLSIPNSVSSMGNGGMGLIDSIATTDFSNLMSDISGSSSRQSLGSAELKSKLNRIQTPSRSKTSTPKNSQKKASNVSKLVHSPKPLLTKGSLISKSALDTSNYTTTRPNLLQYPISASVSGHLPCYSNNASDTALPELFDTLQESGGDTGESTEERREQELLFVGDVYTPRWVRNHATHKQGLCELCPAPGRWLQLKNSAFWYHKQFTHGISSVSCLPFLQPVSLRTVWMLTAISIPVAGKDLTKERKDPTSSAYIMIEGCCHTCNEWIPLMSTKRRCATIQCSLVNVTNLVGKCSPAGATPAVLLTADEKSSKVQVSLYPNGEVVVPPVLLSVSSHFTEGVADIEARRGLVPAWYRHASKCHDHQKPRRATAPNMDAQDVSTITPPPQM
ncbi:hypothetical protein O5D80_004334 [Batrachochytrium dendrobatidis]|nr:hypothetical protein O5D80_004334 [Batrachochytrium dendrobatidis]